jgi:hypothetical protein
VALKLDQPKRRTGVCSFQKLKDGLNASDQSILDDWIENQISPYAIYKALKADGYSIGRQTVYEHINGWCICNGSK